MRAPTELTDSRSECSNCHGICGTGSRQKHGRWYCAACWPMFKDRKPEKRDCACGCGAKVTPPSRFKPGHDAKLKAIVQRILCGEASLDELPADGVTREYLMLAPWVSQEMAGKLGL